MVSTAPAGQVTAVCAPWEIALIHTASRASPLRRRAKRAAGQVGTAVVEIRDQIRGAAEAAVLLVAVRVLVAYDACCHGSPVTAVGLTRLF